MRSSAIQLATILGCLVPVAAAFAEEAVSIGLTETDGGPVISVRGLAEETLATLDNGAAKPAGMAKLLKVFVGEGPADDRPPVLGTVRIDEDRLIFRPRFPFKAGLAYRVVFRPPGATSAKNEDPVEPIEQVIRIDDLSVAEPTFVQAVYPSGEVLPENVLKFYVHFSAPMEQGKVYDHVRLLDGQGKEVEYPFVNLGQELWDRSGTRVTLLLDPGRIKRGLRPREEIGPILEEGRTYTLEIDRAWRDARARPLAQGFRKPFRAAPPDDLQPDPTKWRITPPNAGTSEPLTIHFAEPLDHSMLHSAFSVLSDQQTRMAGTIEVDEGETLWRFFPENEWEAGDYVVVVETSLEDRSGNSIERPFEVDVFERVQARVPETKLSLPLRIR